MSFAAKVAAVRAGLIRQGWMPCAMRGCTNLVAPMEGEKGPMYCAVCEQRKHLLKRGA